MSSSDMPHFTPVHERSFDEFVAGSVVACVRPGPGGVLSVVDLDGPGWSGLDKVRVEVARMFSDQGFSRTTTSTLTNNLVRMALDDGFTNDCKYVPLDGPCTLVFVKEHAARQISPKEVLRRVHADALADAMTSGRAMRAGAGAKNHSEEATC